LIHFPSNQYIAESTFQYIKSHSQLHSFFVSAILYLLSLAKENFYFIIVEICSFLITESPHIFTYLFSSSELCSDENLGSIFQMNHPIIFANSVNISNFYSKVAPKLQDQFITSLSSSDDYPNFQQVL
jgi:hypothetical protein